MNYSIPEGPIAKYQNLGLFLSLIHSPTAGTTKEDHWLSHLAFKFVNYT